MMRSLFLLLAACVAAGFSVVDPPRSAIPAVSTLSVPDSGIQPQAALDGAGVIHLVYFKGDAAGGDLYYVRLTARGESSSPVKVNSVSGSALATGSVRGAQIALGRSGRIHVAWHGSHPIDVNGVSIVPMFYARSDTTGSVFEAQRAVTRWTTGLDGGAIAADRSGRVVVAWHATGPVPGEDHRTVYLAKSSDDGATFSREEPATSAPIGACACCGMRALIDRTGALHVLYRAATRSTNRDATWLTIGGTRRRPPVRVHPWELNACPMSTFALAETAGGLAAAWETAEQIYSAMLNASTGAVSAPVAVPGKGSRKHPSIAVNASGDQLLAWTEGTAWKRGGTAAWRLTDRSGNELAASADAGPVPVWGLVSAVAMPDGSFVIFR